MVLQRLLSPHLESAAKDLSILSNVQGGQGIQMRELIVSISVTDSLRRGMLKTETSNGEMGDLVL